MQRSQTESVPMSSGVLGTALARFAETWLQFETHRDEGGEALLKRQHGNA